MAPTSGISNNLRHRHRNVSTGALVRRVADQPALDPGCFLLYRSMLISTGWLPTWHGYMLPEMCQGMACLIPQAWQCLLPSRHLMAWCGEPST